MWNPIQEKTTRYSSSGMRKYMHLLFAHKDTDSIQDILIYLYKLSPPLMLSDLLSFSFYSTPTSDLHSTAEPLL